MAEGIEIKQKGDFNNFERWANGMLSKKYLKILDKYGKQGVEALKNATPRDTGETANSWYYEIIEPGDGQTQIVWSNSHMTPTNPNISVALLLQYGHGTRNGGYVQGIDYINPAISPIFDKIAGDAWQEVRNS